MYCDSPEWTETQRCYSSFNSKGWNKHRMTDFSCVCLIMFVCLLVVLFLLLFISSCVFLFFKNIYWNCDIKFLC